MDVLFRTTKLQKIANDKRKCQRTFGQDADSIMEHLSWLAAARHLGEFQNQPLQRMTGFHGLIGQEKGLYALCPGYARRIVIKPIGKAAVLSEIFSIEIIVIEDYHS